MTVSTQSPPEASVRKTVLVNASPDHTFRVFTDGMDTWWPREHHVGNAPMKRVRIEGRTGGRCYTEHTDGSESDWGLVLVWDPPRRLVPAWKINTSWKPESDLAKSSEVEVRFTREANGSTRVDLEHRRFDHLGEAGETMRTGVDGTQGWGWLLQQFAEQAARTE
ncbi:MAG: SRPBCC family protein [Acidobacteriota bacterium]